MISINFRAFIICEMFLNQIYIIPHFYFLHRFIRFLDFQFIARFKNHKHFIILIYFYFCFSSFSKHFAHSIFNPQISLICSLNCCKSFFLAFSFFHSFFKSDEISSIALSSFSFLLKS